MTGTQESVEAGSEFGDDEEDEALRQLLDKIERQHRDEVLPSIENPLRDQRRPCVHLEHDQPQDPEERAVVRSSSPGRIRWDPSVAEAEQDEQAQTPLERFRQAPRKPMSVTDLVSPAWCEIQYLFSLSRHGRVRQTPAMQRGSSVHKELEEQVFQTVEIAVATREEHWGLKLWNVIQSLRILEATGTTRELEVFGIEHGQIVTGIIDQLSFECTDRRLEDLVASRDLAAQTWKSLDKDQTTLTDFFARQTHGQQSSQHRQSTARKVYLTDVKTRNSPKLPDDTSSRPARMQLMMYRRLLARLISGEVDAEAIFARFRIDGSQEFSEGFMDELLSLEALPSAAVSSATGFPDAESVEEELRVYNTPLKLWMCMVQQLQQTLLEDEQSISRVLNIEYRQSTEERRILGNRSFLYDSREIEAYLEQTMQMWKGERRPKGVEESEAFKCRICEFADDCQWRQDKVDQHIDKVRSRRTQTPLAPFKSASPRKRGNRGTKAS